MRYQSLTNVNLVVVDGRQWSSTLSVFLAGTLIALLDHFDSHVLVVTSTDEYAEEVERMGEAAGVDMYFHGESLQTTEDFLDRCGYAQAILIPNYSRSKYEAELNALAKLNGNLMIACRSQDALTVNANCVFVDDSQAINICNALRNLHSAQKNEPPSLQSSH